MPIQPGLSAFPHVSKDPVNELADPGLTQRDLAAIIIMSGLASRPEPTGGLTTAGRADATSPRNMAVRAYELADALIDHARQPKDTPNTPEVQTRPTTPGTAPRSTYNTD